MFELDESYVIEMEVGIFKIKNCPGKNILQIFENEFSYNSFFIKNSNNQLIIGLITSGSYPLITLTFDKNESYHVNVHKNRYIYHNNDNVYLIECDGYYETLKDLHYHYIKKIHVVDNWVIDNEDGEHVFICQDDEIYEWSEDLSFLYVDTVDVSDDCDQRLIHIYKDGWKTFHLDNKCENYISPWIKHIDNTYYVYKDNQEWKIDLNIKPKYIGRSWWNPIDESIFFIEDTKMKKVRVYSLYLKNNIKYMIISHRNYILFLVLCLKKSPYHFCCPTALLVNIIIPLIFGIKD